MYLQKLMDYLQRHYNYSADLYEFIAVFDTIQKLNKEIQENKCNSLTLEEEDALREIDKLLSECIKLIIRIYDTKKVIETETFTAHFYS